MANASLQRKNMVESQIRPSDVTDRRITAAMSRIAREAFLPARLVEFAYSDETLTLAPGRELLPPRVLSKLIQLAEIEDSDKVLVVSEAGYAAALIGEIAAKVVALLPDEQSAVAARSGLAENGLANVETVIGPAAAGWPDGSPYDVVLIEGGIQQVPEGLQTQIREGGRIAAIEVNDGLGGAVQLHKRGGVFARREGFQAAALPLPGFTELRAAFVF
jgi:protein-L-isoaspartate(D-aspartate) O-methyltransferase